VHQFAQVGTAECALHALVDGLAPAAAEREADEGFRIGSSPAAMGEGNRAHFESRLVDDHVVVDGDANENLVHRFTGRQFATLITRASIALRILQLRFYIPQSLITQIPIELHVPCVHMASADFRCLGHVFNPRLFYAAEMPPLTLM